MKRRLLIALCLVATAVATVPPARAAFPQIASPPGQLYVVSVNTWQRKVIGVKRFKMMVELTRSLLQRPAAFDGGSENIAAAPDVIVLQEMQPSNLDIFVNLLRQRSDFDYIQVGSDRALGKFVINADRVAMTGSEHLWGDACYESTDPNDPLPRRAYQWAEFTEHETGAPFAVAGIHFDHRYEENTGDPNCLEKNIRVLRSEVAQTQHPTIIAGDFNRRAVAMSHQCDPEEQSAPLPWWSDMTAPTEGRAYDDAVVAWHRTHGLSLAEEWTHEHKTAKTLCDASTSFSRNRIDYMFTHGFEIVDAHADHPGWAGEEPGTRHPDSTGVRYSDHRWVSARLGLTGPPAPAPPTVVPDAGGVMHLSWAPPEVPVAGWLVYRAIGTASYSLLARLSPEMLAYDDLATVHGNRYRYAIAAVDESGAQGIESQPTSAVADARAPQVRSTTPRSGAVAVERRADIIVRYDEAVDPASVSPDTINVYRDGRALCGRAVQTERRVLVFDPCFPLGKKKQYRVVVYAVSDLLGNSGGRREWRFTTR